MRFTAIALASLPDIETARLNHGLSDLSDGDVAKVLVHRRKQLGHGERLGWDQLRIGALSLVRIDNSHAHIESLSLHEHPEGDLLEAIFQAMHKLPPLVTWGGRSSLLPLLQFRCLVHRRSAAEYWTCTEDGREPHIDLQDELLGRPTQAEVPSLDEIAQRLSLPGMLGRDDGRIWERWLAGDHESAGAFADYAALNTALLGSEIYHLKGRCTESEADLTRERLIKAVARGKPAARYSDWLRQIQAHDPS